MLFKYFVLMDKNVLQYSVLGDLTNFVIKYFTHAWDTFRVINLQNILLLEEIFGGDSPPPKKINKNLKNQNCLKWWELWSKNPIFFLFFFRQRRRRRHRWQRWRWRWRCCWRSNFDSFAVKFLFFRVQRHSLMNKTVPNWHTNY